MAPPRSNSGTSGGEGDGRKQKSLRASIKNRTKGLCKKAYELATLCDVELALVCYTSDGAEPTTWPPDRSKVKDAIHHYLETPAHKKLPKNQITLGNPNTGDGEEKDAGEAAAAAAKAKAKAEEEAERLRIPFPDDEDKLIALGGILDSRLEAVRKMIAVRRTEGRRDPMPCALEPGENVARFQGGPPLPAAAVAAAGAGGSDLGASDRVRGRIVAAAAGGGGGGAPNCSDQCTCHCCPIHSHMFSTDRTVVDGSWSI